MTMRSDHPAEYRCWSNMRQRCSNSNRPEWQHYGGRGITVCAEWDRSFEAFLADMGSKPPGRYSIERRNNELGYEPGNCYWATPVEQAANRSRPRAPNASGFNVVGGSWLIGQAGTPAPTYRIKV